jgi:hypothetical protein
MVFISTSVLGKGTASAVPIELEKTWALAPEGSRVVLGFIYAMACRQPLLLASKCVEHAVKFADRRKTCFGDKLH